MNQETVTGAAVKTNAASKTAVTPGLRRFWRDSALEVLALLGGAAIWEALGWSLRLQWLPPFSQVMTALLQFVRKRRHPSQYWSEFAGIDYWL